ncbi:MAG: 16S rRNA (guanine(527)-N(7))-methyltransferase RsmG [Zoogloeaceae bacterium]|jgi:16S rRNA (guanine527-N7)-methyltransferase|nr:16S rRNA (guanine(527)-N(7))-methyltransferase RsmG [Zoogloeaceae bacterium]
MTLNEGIHALGLTMPPDAGEKLERYLTLLQKWNRVYNLTAIHDREQMVTHHLLDSLAVLPHLKNIHSLADVGSGGGLPALPLAICRPDLQVTSVESNQKKAAFQQQAKIELDLSNVSIHCARSEAMTGTFDAVISRAFAELAEFVRLAGHLARRLLAMKGAYPEAELGKLPPEWRLVEAVPLTVPGLGAERHLIVLERS